MRLYNTLIYDDKFEVCSGADTKIITNPVFHKNTQFITPSAFKGMNLESVILNNRCVIGGEAFYENYYLKEIRINATDIGYNAFRHCGIYSLDGMNIKLLNNIEVIEDSAFADCYINKLELNDNLKMIKMYAFADSRFNNPELILPSGLEIIELGAFDDTNLTDIYLQDNVKEVGSLFYSKINFHMSLKLAIKFGVQDKSNIIINKNIDELLSTMTYKELNKFNLENDKINQDKLQDK